MPLFMTDPETGRKVLKTRNRAGGKQLRCCGEKPSWKTHSQGVRLLVCMQCGKEFDSQRTEEASKG